MKNKPIFLVLVATKKSMVINTEVQNGYCIIGFQLYFIWISKNNHKYCMLFAVFTWTTTTARQKTKNGNENLQRASWYLHQIKKSIYI